MAAKGTLGPLGGSDLQDSSESEPEVEQCWTAVSGLAYGSYPYKQVIHSGHFMVSSPHSERRGRRCSRYDFDTVNRTWCQTYRYGPYRTGRLSIDPTLTRLFECMSLAYSAKIVSPKWKSFKGLRLLWRDKIRLNNAIWRAWFIQYVEKRKNPVCGFVTPLEGSEADAHRKPEAIVLEGSYWKRRIEVVINEYHKWRIYYKKRLQREKDGTLSTLQEGQLYQVDKWSSQMYSQPEATPADSHMFNLDFLLSNVSDTLFTMTQKPCHWTSERQNNYTTNADMIQPGLTPLQPNLDDFIEIPDIFMNYLGPTYEQTTAFADSGFFESSFVPPIHTSQLLIDTQSTQADPVQFSSFSPQSATSRFSQDINKFHSSSLSSYGTYGESSHADPLVSEQTTSVDHVVSTTIPFFCPLPCHKMGYHPAASNVTPTVITHTASTMESTQHAHSYPHPEHTYPQLPCQSISYPSVMSGPVHTVQPSAVAPSCFSASEQMATTEMSWKHKQKRAGLRTVGHPGGLSYHPLAPTSCLAKLLSTGKSPVGLQSSHVAVKGRRSSSPSSLHGNRWHAEFPVLKPSAWRLGETQRRSPKGSALLPDDAAHSSTALLIPKTENLSPVQVYGTDRSSLPGYLGQKSSPIPLDNVSHPECQQSGYGKLDSSKQQTQNRRITHISAEQKRRFNIKLGFDTLHNLVTTLSSQPSIKISKATTLQKTAKHISKMQQERSLLQEEVQRLQNEIQHLNSAINSCQQQLPATGVPITRQHFDHMRKKFREYVQTQTLQNWKFWIFSVIMEPLFESYNGMVSTASVELLCQSTLSWLDQHCSLPSLRPMVLSSLRLLSTSTSILTDPSLLPQQATLAVTQGAPGGAVDDSMQPLLDNTRNM
ncbi:carbohydrate-responsive element-binding protein-like isoform X1 [Nerophis ophidion]|uniref:carbohydrate-responsive element-binding protein-like isoform X1 n=1 Tax=Nerophis ophidion TaxID=159077 RepID=UPI002AE08756|nr:carbohydrate-responsive element-binding protein-like isoform X1 [Nerophis ophidion]